MFCETATPKKKKKFYGLKKFLETYLDEFSKKAAINMVIRLHKDLAKSRFANWIILSVKLVEPVKGVAIL